MQTGETDGLNGFESAAATDRVIAMMVEDAAKGPSTRRGHEVAQEVRIPPSRRFRRPWAKPEPTHTVGLTENRG